MSITLIEQINKKHNKFQSRKILQMKQNFQQIKKLVSLRKEKKPPKRKLEINKINQKIRWIRNSRSIILINKTKSMNQKFIFRFIKTMNVCMILNKIPPYKKNQLKDHRNVR